MERIRIVYVSPASPDLARLIRKLDAYLDTLYPPEEIFRIDFSDPAVRETYFAVAYDDGTAVGCGAIRPLEAGEAELKRFYVEPAYRRNGIAGRLLACLENKARELQFAVMKLETGAPQAEAVHFYKKHGYEEIERFGEYRDCPSSLCFAKTL